jgi:CxxC motif-containing protein (DUF1111 family)
MSRTVSRGKPLVLRRFRRPWRIPACVILAAGAPLACVDEPAALEETPRIELPMDVAESRSTTIGGVLPGTDPDEFAEAEDAFAEVETIDEGLGPVFNDRGCASCHSLPVTGGSGVQVERRFGRLTNGIFDAYDADPENHGGSLRQLFSNATYNFAGQSCTVPVEIEPVTANVKNVGRRTTPLFGLGLVDAMPDWWFDLLAATQPSSIRGVVQRVPVVLPDERDPTQFVGSLRVGRFGWKGQVPTLLVFSGDAYNNEMGITTQSCFKGKSILAFAYENLPNNVAPIAGCNGGDLAPAQTPHPDVPQFTDDAVGPCSRNRTEIQEDVALFATFMERLAPPPPKIKDPKTFALGAFAFAKVGCAGCHVAVPFITPSRPYNEVPGNYPFFPFSDFLAHDMGSLGDCIGATGDPVAKTRLMRTAPLWGARLNPCFLHDCRAPTVRDAIIAHDGQGKPARDAFLNLSSFLQSALLNYVLSL